MHAGNIIKFLRQQHNLTQKDLSKILGVNISSVQKYESAAVNNLKMETIRTLCDYFNLSPIVFVFPEEIELEHLAAGTYIKGRFVNHTKRILALNAEGVEKVMIYVEDLVATGKYQKVKINSK